MAAQHCTLRRRNFIQIILLIDALEEENEEKTRDRQVWARDWMRRRQARGAFVPELASEDEEAFINYFRMNQVKFHFVTARIQEKIAKKNTLMREAISPAERLAVTLRYLATGETFSSLEKQFRISRTAISAIVIEVCEAIIAVLGPEFLTTPRTKPEWLKISSKFESRWNFPNGLFAIDGKRVLVQQPPNSGSHYFDYKGHNSILAMVAVGPEYEVIFADVGMNGRMSDGGNWARNQFRALLTDMGNPLNVPDARPLPGRNQPVPYVAVGDDAFALTTSMLKPYPLSSLTTEQRIFNYRLSRMRRISENVLGIMAQKFRVLRNVMLVGPEKATTIVMAIMVLHNFLRSDKCYINPANIDEDVCTDTAQSTSSWLDLPPLIHGQNYSKDAKEIRNEFCNYFNLEGAVNWQWVAARIDG